MQDQFKKIDNNNFAEGSPRKLNLLASITKVTMTDSFEVYNNNICPVPELFVAFSQIKKI